MFDCELNMFVTNRLTFDPRNSFFEVVGQAFEPETCRLIYTRFARLEMWLTAEAMEEIIGRQEGGASETTMESVKLRTWLEVESILCVEFR